MNVCGLVGRATADIELKQTQSGVSVCSFTLAVRRTKEVTDFIPCIAWRQTAEMVSKYFHKGDMFAVTGEIQSRKYTDKNGGKHTAIEVSVQSVSFCGSKAQETADAPTQSAGAVPQYEELQTGDEDLPF